MSARFEGLEFHHVAQENNQAANVLARIGAKCDPVPPNIFLERLFKPSVVWEGETDNFSPDPKTTPDSKHSGIIGGFATEITPSAHVIMAITAPWIEPFLAYLNRQELPEDQNEARCIVRRSKSYKVQEGGLYKKSATGVLQRCISEEEGQQLLAEIHAGLGGHHAVARALVSKAFRTGFLLADGPSRRTGPRPTLRQLPAFCKSKPYATYRSPNSPHNLALCGLGARYGWTP